MCNRIVRRLRRSEEGFTLIELLVVVAIIALLATFAVPKLFDAINKSKKAPGQADLQTISSALERHYFDNNKYPTTTNAGAAAATDVKNLLRSYLKSTTTYRNGFKQGYLYVTSTSGAGYFFVDLQGQSQDDVAASAGQQIQVTCGSGAGAQTITLTVSTGDTADLVVDSTITDANINSCTLANANTSIAVVTH